MGTDKALLVLDGVTLLVRAATRLATVADPVLLATGRPGRLGRQPWTEVPDAEVTSAEATGAGPLAAIVGGLRASPHPLVAVVAVDAPFADAHLLADLARQWQGEAALVPVDREGRPQPLHALYAKAAADGLQAALQAGQRRVLDAVVAAGGRLVELTAPERFDPRWAENWNRPDDISGNRE